MGGLVRRAYTNVLYKGKEISRELAAYITSMTITDNLKGSFDDLDISLRNDENRFLNSGYCLDLEAQLSVDIITENWEYSGEVKKKVPCGIYYIDDRDFSEPSVSVKGISGPIGPLQDQTNSKEWENINLKSLAQEFAKKYKLELMFLCKDLKFMHVEQQKETDLSFLQKIVNDEGLALKINFNKMIIFDEEDFEKRDVSRILDLKGREIKKNSWRIREKTKEIYDVCKVSIVNTETGETEDVTYNKNGEKIEIPEKSNLKILKLNTRSLSKNIDKFAKHQLRRANQKEITFSCIIIGDVSAMAGQTFKLINAGIFNGKYIMDKVTKSLNPFEAQIESYRVNLEKGDGNG